MKKLADTIVEKHEPKAVVETVNATGDLNAIALNLIAALETSHVRFRELHWAADKLSEHKLLDEIDNEVLGLLDEVAELSMGILHKKFGVGDIKRDYELDAAHTCEGLLGVLEEVILNTKKDLGDDPKYSGIHSVLDDFIGKINKWNYLKTLS